MHVSCLNEDSSSNLGKDYKNDMVMIILNKSSSSYRNF